MDVPEFTLNVGSACVLGIAIGLERHFRQTTAGLRTNTLVCLGAALFVSLSRLIEHDSSPTRIAGQVASGIGFLGGGVILREGMNLKGLNTAATLWCSAAIGTLAGAGLPLHGLVGTVAVVGLNIVLRPMSRWIDARTKTMKYVETHYRLRVVCPETDERLVRAILMRHINSNPTMLVQGISQHDTDKSGTTAVVADIHSQIRNERALEELLNRLNIEPGITSVSWERVA